MEPNTFETILPVILVLVGAVLIVGYLCLPIALFWWRRRVSDDLARDFCDIILAGYTIVAVLGLLAVAGALFLPFFPFSIVFALIGMYVSVMTVFERYVTQRVVVVRALAAAAERQIPLAPLVRALARESGLFYRWRLRRLAKHLESGATLLDAVQAVPGVVPDSGVVAIVVGTLAGRLAPPLREVAEAHALERPMWRGVALGAVYLFALLSLAFLYTQGMVYYILPKFQQISEDFGMPVDTPMLWLQRFADSPWMLLVSLTIFVLLLAMLIVSLLLSLGVIRWSLGPFSRFRRRIDAALIMRSLASMADADKPFGPLVEALSSGYPSVWARRRLGFAAHQIAIGSDWCAALESQGLIGAADAAVIQAGQRVGNLSWVLRELATSSERRFVYRLSALGQVLLPLAVVVCGLLVLLIVTVCFQPLVEMIANLT